MSRRLLGFAVVAAVVGAWASSARADVAADLKAAAAEDHPVFLIVTEGQAKGTQLARRVCAEAAAKVDGARVVELDRAAAAEADTVKRYRLATVEVPLILVIAGNGVAAAATKPSAVTAGRLARMVPSPAKAAYLKALDEGKSAFLVVADERTPGRAGAIAACETAAKSLDGKAAVVVVGMADDREAPFREELKVPVGLVNAQTIVFNAKGQRTETFDAVPTATAVVEASKKVVEECCPGGRCK